MSETKITDGDLAGITARAKRDVYVEIGRILYETGEGPRGSGQWAKAVQNRLRDELGIQLYRGGDEIPGGVDSNLVMSFVRDPESGKIASALNLTGAWTCECERNPCVSCCGVYLDKSVGGWRAIPQEWRLDWLATVTGMHVPDRRPGPRLLELCGAERATPEWLAQSTSLISKLAGRL